MVWRLVVVGALRGHAGGTHSTASMPSQRTGMHTGAGVVGTVHLRSLNRHGTSRLAPTLAPRYVNSSIRLVQACVPAEVHLSSW